MAEVQIARFRHVLPPRSLPPSVFTWTLGNMDLIYFDGRASGDVGGSFPSRPTLPFQLRSPRQSDGKRGFPASSWDRVYNAEYASREGSY